MNMITSNILNSLSRASVMALLLSLLLLLSEAPGSC